MKEIFLGRVEAETKGRGICPRCGQERELTIDGPCVECLPKSVEEFFYRCFRGVRLAPVSTLNHPA
jgi:hypothetical protein